MSRGSSSSGSTQGHDITPFLDSDGNPLSPAAISTLSVALSIAGELVRERHLSGVHLLPSHGGLWLIYDDGYQWINREGRLGSFCIKANPSSK
jgi:hypothetical protein